MDLHVLGKEVEITDAVRDYAQKKIIKMSRLLPSAESAKVEVSKQKSRLPDERFKVQLTITSKGDIFRVEEKAKNFNLALDKAADKMKRQIIKFKGRLYSKNKINNQVLSDTKSSKTTRSKQIVKLKSFTVKPMTVDEAVIRMEQLSHDFYLFSNSETERLNLLYRRKDGHYGLIQPEL